MKILAVDYATYRVSDLAKSIDFYQNTLGLTLTASGEGWAEFQAGNLAIALVVGLPTKSKENNGAGVAFAVDDIDGTLDELRRKKVKVQSEAWETPVCHGASIEDPDGNAIYLHKRKDGSVG